MPRAGLILEKLATERSGEKGDRDLLVALALLLVLDEADREELRTVYDSLPHELRYTIVANLSTLALIEARPGMPDPEPHRARVADLRRQLEKRGVW
jgi:hypothetical protein